MENKYYVPELKDFYPGFEYEQYAPGTGDDWKKETFGLWAEETRFIRAVYEKGYESGWIRVPYLTKGQIEAEGWTYTGRTIDMWFEKEGSFEIGSWTSYKIRIHYGTDHRLFINAVDVGNEESIFQGECKSINEFRTIMRWLKLS
jgi:hypothetical protein